jgi:hypothetical protein
LVNLAELPGDHFACNSVARDVPVAQSRLAAEAVQVGSVLLGVGA